MASAWRAAAILLLAILASVAIGPAASAGGDRVALRFHQVLAELELSEGQREVVLTLRRRLEADLHRLGGALRRKATELSRRLEATPGDERAIEELVQEVGRLRTEMLRLRVRAIRDLQALLTAEQQSRLGALEDRLRRGAGVPRPQ